MINTIERMTQLKDGINNALRVMTGNTTNMRRYNIPTYEFNYSSELIDPVKINIDMTIYMDKSYEKEYDKENIHEVEFLPEMPDDLKLALSMYGIFTWVKISCSRKLTEKEVIHLKDIGLNEYIQDTIHKVSRREIPIISTLYDNTNTGFFFVKYLFKNPYNIDETIFIIGDHGENTIALIDHLKISSRRLYDFKFISSHAYLAEEKEIECDLPELSYSN